MLNKIVLTDTERLNVIGKKAFTIHREVKLKHLTTPDKICKCSDGTWIAWEGAHSKKSTQEKMNEVTNLLYPNGGGFLCPIAKVGDFISVYAAEFTVVEIEVEKIDGKFMWRIKFEKTY
jgi:hypothetical protein